MTQFVSPMQVWGDTAAWAIGAGEVSGSLCYACDATDEVANLWIPVLVPSNSAVDISGAASKGSLLKSIEIDYEIKTAACDAVTAYIYKMKRGANGADVVVSAPTFTYDTGHDTAAERYTVDEHKMTLTLDTAVYIENDEYYYVKIAFDKAATSICQFLGAFVNTTFRA
jgi:hypothetical protein